MRADAADVTRQNLDDLLGRALDLLVTWQAALILVALAVWFLVLQAVLAATRPAGIDPAPATQDFGGDEPPAIVSLLANRWRITVDAVESTMLDLAARRFVELRQQGDDPRQTTIHLLPEDGPRKGPAELAPYERQVLERVRGLARNGMLPITALTFRDPGEAGRWTRQFEELVRDDARRAGLSRPRLSGALKRLLSLAALLPAGATGLFVWSTSSDPDDRFGAAAGGALLTWGAVSAWGARYRGERDTEAGRKAATRWAGLSRWLQNDEAFQALPPAGVTVWDRYLPYGTALGANHVCSAVLDLGMGDREQVWSSFGGEWHRVRVRYPRFWGRFGRAAPRLCLTGVVAAALGLFVLNRLSHQGALRAVGLLLLARGVYQFARVIGDLLAPRELTGEVLWVEVWRQKKGKGEDAPPVPWLYWFAVDDGTGDRTRAWGLPAELLDVASPTDQVTMTVRPWSRRVLRLAKVAAPAAPPGPTVPPPTPAAAPAAPPSAPAGPSPAPPSTPPGTPPPTPAGAPPAPPPTPPGTPPPTPAAPPVSIPLIPALPPVLPPALPPLLPPPAGPPAWGTPPP